ncbi:MAG: DUF4010 domain-containing protein [Bacteroidota bacterium]|nr:DUF4010 domain-containing protein [Bacteroidota bacterium]
MEIFSHIPKELVNFLLVVLFSLLIGLEQRRLHIDSEFESLFGTDRTITLIGILGFILYTVMPNSLGLFYGGGVIVSALLGTYYYQKIKLKNKWGFTSLIIALITYCLTPLVDLEPLWLVMLVVVTILIIVEIKESLFMFSRKFDRNEFTLLAKFIIIGGIILPLLPHEPLSPAINISPYQIWVSIVAVSGISYLSYLLRKFAFPNSGIILSAILGGLYSSTATTIILARKSKEENNDVRIVSGILGATAMMYLRILLLAWIFNTDVALMLAPYFLVFVCVILAFIAVLQMKNKAGTVESTTLGSKGNPLEFKTALIFGLLFAFFAILTNLVIKNYGNAGVNILSFIVGVTDIDPYILNLFQHVGGNLQVSTIVHATIIATASNNLIKMVYSLILATPTMNKKIGMGFITLILVSIVSILFF